MGSPTFSSLALNSITRAGSSSTRRVDRIKGHEKGGKGCADKEQGGTPIHFLAFTVMPTARWRPTGAFLPRLRPRQRNPAPAPAPSAVAAARARPCPVGIERWVSSVGGGQTTQTRETRPV